MKFLPRVCDPLLFSRLPGTQFPVSMLHSEHTQAKFNVYEKNIALFRYYFIECITFKLRDSKNMNNLKKEIL